MAAKKKASPKSPRSPRLFPSPRRIPRSVRWAHETWMLFFEDFCQSLISTADDDTTEASTLGMDPDRHTPQMVNRVKLARVLADQALEEVQDRWPGVRV